jgi:hypothetical protein
MANNFVMQADTPKTRLIKESARIERLTSSEIKQIRKMVIGYGNFTATAEKTKLSAITFRDIINKGYATPKNIKKIRAALFQ